MTIPEPLCFPLLKIYAKGYEITRQMSVLANAIQTEFQERFVVNGISHCGNIRKGKASVNFLYSHNIAP